MAFEDQILILVQNTGIAFTAFILMYKLVTNQLEKVEEAIKNLNVTMAEIKGFLQKLNKDD